MTEEYKKFHFANLNNNLSEKTLDSETDAVSEADSNIVSISQEEYNNNVEESYQKGYEQGFNKGLEEAKAQNEVIQQEYEEKLKEAQQITETLTNLSEQLTQAENNFNNVQKDVVTKIIALTNDIYSKTINKILLKTTLPQIENVIRDNLKKLHSEDRIYIKLNTAILGTIKKNLSSIMDSIEYRDKIVLLNTDSIDITSCIIEWKYGLLEYNAQHLIDEINRIIQRGM